ncbi:MAG: hypothetical protein SFV23_03410 [Planctomycetaceae bacterium]|nr:hypothetical protein [Planctomycetaceae bacterium]
MRIVVVSPIGGTRRSLEIWLSETGHKVLVAESFERAIGLLTENPDSDVVISEWLLCGHTAYDLLKHAKRVTRITDAEELTQQIQLVIVTTPGVQSPRLTDQLDAVTSLSNVAVLEKPISRWKLDECLERIAAQADSGCSLRSDSSRPQAEAGSAAGLESNGPANSRALEVLDTLSALLAEVQRKQRELRDLIREANSAEHSLSHETA